MMVLAGLPQSLNPPLLTLPVVGVGWFEKPCSAGFWGWSVSGPVDHSFDREKIMPIITVTMAKGRTLEEKRSLTRAITESVVGVLDVKPEWVSVVVHEIDRENWATGGELHIDRFGPGCGKKGNEPPGERP